MKILNEVFAKGRSAPLSASVKRCFSSIAEAVNGSFLHWNVQTSQTSQTFRTCSHAGFTVLELLVASLLLGMLVTMLTMIFNQSSIAWRTGISSVSKLETQRERIGGYHDIADDALPGIGDVGVSGIENPARQVRYRTVSVFKNWDGNSMPMNQSRDVGGRLFETINWNSLTPITSSGAMRGQTIGLPNAGYANGRDSIVVGVRSYGPDRQKDTEDDINTYPEEVE